MSALPLYSMAGHYGEIGQPALAPSGNAGLWFERFAPHLGHSIEAPKRTLYFDPWGKQLIRARTPEQLLDRAVSRQKGLVLALGGACRTFKANWHFVTGLGRAHLTGNGFMWHHTLGAPYLPGSSVKGLVRAWLAHWSDPFPEAEWLARCFGHSAAEDGETSLAGGLVFFDALPAKPPQLVVDVMTPHAGNWYAWDETVPEDRDLDGIVPSDWSEPVPVHFLAANGLELQFAIAPRSPEFVSDLEAIWKALEQALAWLGAGAKTAAGYGRMIPVSATLSRNGGEGTVAVPEAWDDAEVRYLPGPREVHAIGPEKAKAMGKLDALATVVSELVAAKLKRQRSKAFIARVLVQKCGNGYEIVDIRSSEETS